MRHVAYKRPNHDKAFGNRVMCRQTYNIDERIALGYTAQGKSEDDIICEHFNMLVQLMTWRLIIYLSRANVSQQVSAL